MKYLILIHSNPATHKIWEGMSKDERAEGLKAHAAFTEDLAASGELVASEALHDPAQGTRVSVQDGRTLTSDGPFAEAKEHLAGFYLVDCKSRERVIELAARLPEAAHEMVEVRPVRSIDDLDAW